MLLALKNAIIYYNHILIIVSKGTTMKKSSVLLSFAITIATVFTTSGCAMQESYDSYIPDPFETFESNTLIGDDIKENTAAQNL